MIIVVTLIYNLNSLILIFKWIVYSNDILSMWNIEIFKIDTLCLAPCNIKNLAICLFYCMKLSSRFLMVSKSVFRSRVL